MELESIHLNPDVFSLLKDFLLLYTVNVFDLLMSCV